MTGKKSRLAAGRFTRLQADFADALGVPASEFVEMSEYEQDFCWRKDYRYKKNQTLPFFLIELYDRSTRIVIDTMAGSRVYEWHDDETFEALRPVIHKTLKKSFEELEGQVVYEDREMKVIVRPSTLQKSDTLMYLWHKGEEYHAEAREGEISLRAGSVPLDAFAVYMHAIEKYLLPAARQSKEIQDGQ